MEQGTTEWLKSRLGKFNGSEVGDLMGSPKTKGKQWTDTALKLIYKVAAERHLSFLLMYDDSLLEEFLARSGAQTVAMKWGHEHEKDAVNELAAQLTREGVKGFQMKKEASVIHPTVKVLAASPDRIVEIGGENYIVEIKCPYNPANAFLAQKTVNDWESLKKWNPAYYWQVVAEIACNGAKGAYFCVYDPHQEETLHKVFLPKDDAVELQLINRVLDAEEYIANNL